MIELDGQRSKHSKFEKDRGVMSQKITELGSWGEGKVQANITCGVTAVNTSAKASTQALRTSSNFHRIRVNRTMENTTRKSFPVVKKASELGSSDVQGEIRSMENSARKTGYPVKTRAGGKLIPQVSTLKGKVSKEKVNDGFTLKALRNPADKGAVRGVRKSEKPVARTRLQIPSYRKNLKSKSFCHLPKSLGTTSAQRVKVATSIAKPPIGSCEEVTEAVIPAEGSDNLKSQGPESSEFTATKKSGRRKSYTSSLISRPKLLELRNEASKYEQLPNIDDEGNPLEVVEYIDDIYEYYWMMEAQNNSLENYMMIQTDATPRMRGILINWLVEVHLKFDLMPETLYLSVALLDRYLSLVTLKKKQFQLVGLVSLLLASKYEDFWHPRVKDLISISAESYTRKQLLEMEKSILKKLKFRLNLPTAYVFMLRFLKASQSGKQLENLAFYLIELCLVDYEALRFRPSLLCASAVYVARCTLNEVPVWTSLLGKHARYEEHQIRDCAEMILRIHKGASTSLLKVTHDKYMQPEFGAAAAVRPLDSLPSL
ncbi:putative cyclin-B3-1 [Bienertia sinuspersici]